MSNTTDDDNLVFATSQDDVDQLNSEFYGRFTFPWPPQMFERVVDPGLETVMLNQAIGSWDARECPGNGRIWVAGCGTNQGVITALKYPAATIVATDLSRSSLETSSRIARSLELRNVTFERQSINDAKFSEEFDYVLCTGVVHHNADPRIAVQRLRAALKPRGLCELMVYNRYHRVWTTAFQKVIQILTDTRAAAHFDLQMQLTKRLINSRVESSMAMFFGGLRDSPEAAVADACMQPIEHSYTVASLQELLGGGELELVTPCVSQFNKTSARETFWTVGFDDPELASRYTQLPDVARWQIANLLLLERSPLLWFYVQRRDCERAIKPERQLCDEFLGRTFRRVNTRKQVYLQGANGTYTLSSQTHPYPAPHPDATCRRILGVVEESRGATMREVFVRLGLKEDFAEVNRLRLMLTTCLFPYLVGTAQPEPLKA